MLLADEGGSYGEGATAGGWALHAFTVALSVPAATMVTAVEVTSRGVRRGVLGAVTAVLEVLGRAALR